MKIAILGGGLAGCATAFKCKEAGLEPDLYEAGPGLAGGASGNDTGSYSPRFSALRGPESDFYSAAYFLALKQFEHFDYIDWNPCGALHLITDEKKDRQLRRTAANWGWGADHMRLLDREEASKVANMELQRAALYLPHSGTVSPRKLCAAYANGISSYFNRPIDSLEEIDADVIVLACGPAVSHFAPELPLTPVRGQVTEIRATERSARLSCSISYEGYVTPAKEGVHTVGATFQPSVDSTLSDTEDDLENISKLKEALPQLQDEFEVVSHRAAVRASSRDRFPIVGPLTDRPGLYVTTGHGSYGLLSTLMAAELLADMILDRPYCLPNSVTKILSPERFKPKQDR
ncbi:MAG: FAD-dependent 5-carboxymethylaminomethyl-2-thiouridine(34) oxidoreductase MnmC [Proteobacteria bacterium]|nr:FAD-dependent 5-carboxymethylaminomethyl-2-thiouridine(34) oxidoreductase MnmC [Pseudomonadota bacterium]